MRKLNLILISLVTMYVSLSHSEIRTSLVAENLSFLSPDYTADKKNFAFIGANVKSDSKSEDPFNIDLTGSYAVGNSVLSSLNIREVFYTIKIDEVSDIHMGRKTMDWSSTDKLWNFGVYQPQFRWNQLNPQNQGLTGLFWSKNDSSYGLTLFATPIYLPDQGPSYEIKDGQFQSSNPFFQAPPQNIRFQGQILPIDYEITKPETSDVVFQSQMGAQLRFGEEKGYFARISGMFKPSNQLALGYKGVLVTTRVRVDVLPKTYYENVYSADFGIKDNWGFAQFGALYSKPQNPEFDPAYNAPQFEPSLSFGPQFLYRYKPFEFFAAYVDTSGGQVTDVGPDASPDRASLSERFLYKQAALLKVNYSEVFLKQFRWTSMFEYKFGSKESFRQIRFKNIINIRGPWAFWAEVLLLDNDSAVRSNRDAYKNLDQLWLGASYDL